MGKRNLFQCFGPRAIIKKYTTTFLRQPSLVLFSQRHQFFIIQNDQSAGFLLHIPINNLLITWNERNERAISIADVITLNTVLVRCH